MGTGRSIKVLIADDHQIKEKGSTMLDKEQTSRCWEKPRMAA
jgi:hypothetical protein